MFQPGDETEALKLALAFGVVAGTVAGCLGTAGVAGVLGAKKLMKKRSNPPS